MGSFSILSRLMVSLAGATKVERGLERGGIVSMVPQEREVDIVILAS
jgi:ribosomal protein S25